MYCKVCGTKNDSSSRYCKNDGCLIIDDESNIVVKSNDKRFCANCGESKDFKDIYCSNCGFSFYDEVSFEEDRFTEIGKDMEEKLKSVKELNLGKILGMDKFLYGLTGIIITLIFSFIFTSSANRIISEQIFEGGESLLSAGSLKLINVLDTLLIMTGPKVNFIMDVLSRSESIGILLKGGFLGLLLIPIVGFAVLGFIKGNNDLKNDDDIEIVGFFSNGLVFALFIAIMAIARKGEATLPIGMFNMNINFIRRYSFIHSFISSFIIYSIGTSIGYSIVLYLNKDYKFNSIVENIFKGIIVFSLITIVIMVLGLILIFVKEPALKKLDFFGFLMGFRMIGIFIALINMGSYSTAIDEETITAFSKDLNNLGAEGSYLIFFLIMIAFIFFLFFFIGKEGKKKGDNRFFIVPISYGVMVFLLSYLQNMEYSTGKGTLDMLTDIYSSIIYNIGDFRLLIGAMMIPLAAATVGYLVTEQEEDYE